jgi:hypothetical protein
MNTAVSPAGVLWSNARKARSFLSWSGSIGRMTDRGRRRTRLADRLPPDPNPVTLPQHDRVGLAAPPGAGEPVASDGNSTAWAALEDPSSHPDYHHTPR